MTPYSYNRNPKPRNYLEPPSWANQNQGYGQQATSAWNPAPQSPAPAANNYGFTMPYAQDALPGGRESYLGAAILRELIGTGVIGNQVSQIGPYLQRQNQFRQQALNALDPSQIGSLVNAFRSRAMGSADAEGRRMGMALMGQGYGPQAMNAAMLDARNKASMATNQYAAQAYNPEALAQRAAMGMQFSDPSQVMNLIPMIQALANMELNYETMERGSDAQKGQGGFGGVLGGLLGSVAGGLNWNSILKVKP